MSHLLAKQEIALLSASFPALVYNLIKYIKNSYNIFYVDLFIYFPSFDVTSEEESRSV